MKRMEKLERELKMYGAIGTVAEHTIGYLQKLFDENDLQGFHKTFKFVMSHYDRTGNSLPLKYKLKDVWKYKPFRGVPRVSLGARVGRWNDEKFMPKYENCARNYAQRKVDVERELRELSVSLHFKPLLENILSPLSFDISTEKDYNLTLTWDNEQAPQVLATLSSLVSVRAAYLDETHRQTVATR